jgi:asparagine synthase (glutamine-hydrolysing)
MCGFVGVFGKYEDEINFLQNSINVIKHRGPDFTGFYGNDIFTVSHARLAILDLSEEANQPFKSDNHVLAYNGEIYNHKNIRRDLLPDIKYKTASDTETLFHLLSKSSSIETEFEHLQGMYAGAFYDLRKKALTLFRDNLAIKPLYIYQPNENSIAFASEIKALISLYPNLKKDADLETIGCYLQYENYPQNHTLFKSIKMLAPGSVLKYKFKDGALTLAHEHKIKLKSTYNEKPSLNSKLFIDIENLIVESVKRHLISDVPVGVYLSGGIDSSIVATIAAKHNSNLEGFTGYFTNCNKYYDERKFARLVANNSNLKLNEVNIQPKDFLAQFDKLIYTLDSPRMGMGAFSQYVVANEAKKYATVMLAGHGGDELFAGYPIFKSLQFFQHNYLQKLIRIFQFKSKELPWLINSYYEYLINKKIAFAPNLQFIKSKLTNISELSKCFYTDKESDDYLEELNYYYYSVYLPGLLVVEDKISMAHSIETRVPLWSQELLSYVKNISTRQKLQKGQLKYILKQIALKYIPKEVVNAPKRGFPTPLRHWFRNELYDFVRNRLTRNNSPLLNIFNKTDLAKLVDSHKKTYLPFSLDEKRAHSIWMLLCLESWTSQNDIDLNLT